MTRAQPRASLYSASLVRFLTENAMLNAAPVADDIGPGRRDEAEQRRGQRRIGLEQMALSSCLKEAIA